MSDNMSKTRYARVQEILDYASGDQIPDYNGLGAFWRQPSEDLAQAVLYGVPLVAAPTAAPKLASSMRRAPSQDGGSCCGSQAQTSADDCAPEAPPPLTGAYSAGRGAASGLIKGLRGEFPYDGQVFPRLPWRGEAVSDDDIQFISEWIDDGLPEDDYEIEIPDAPADPSALLNESVLAMPAEEILDGIPAPSDAYTPGENELNKRMNVEFMTPDQLDAFRYAHQELIALNKYQEDVRSYNNIALIHQNHCQHGWERFLPWHRVYMYEFEQALQDVVPGVTLPYWDWTMPMYQGGDGDIMTPYKAYLKKGSLRYFASVGMPDQDIAALAPMVSDGHGSGPSYNTQTAFFCAVKQHIAAAHGGDTGYADQFVAKYRNDFIVALLKANPLWYPLRYPNQFGSSTIEAIFSYHYPTAEDVRQIQAVRNFWEYGGGSQYNSAFGWMDQNPHNTMHIWSGGVNPEYDSAHPNQNQPQSIRRTWNDMFSQPQYGDMLSNLTASYDPIFWPHHVNIDRLWSEWQRENPHALPEDMDSALSPWTYSIKDVLNIHRFGYEYVRSAVSFKADQGSPISRYTSGKATVPAGVISGCRRAEIRIHQVPQLTLSCFVLAFINQPDADANTPTQGNPNYAGHFAIFGHGDCIGGPGHCDLPPARPRAFDRRGRHMNTPRVHRIDATKCVKALVGDDASAAEVQITLVVLGPDHRSLSGVFRMDGVSLNFQD